MNHETALEELKEIAELQKSGGGDLEGDHIKADTILCEFLESLGYKDISEAFDKIRKWYA